MMPGMAADGLDRPKATVASLPPRMPVEPPPPRPVISVVLAVRNEAAHIDAQLAALSGQRLSEPWEVIVADTGSSDDTVVRARAWSDRMPRLRVLTLEADAGFGVPDASIAAAEGDELAFCDGDDVVGAGWLAAVHDALADHDLVTGPIELRRLNQPWQLRGEDPDKALERPPGDGFLPFALGCNLGIRREVFEAHGGFDRSLYSGADKELSWRLQLAGVLLHFAPGALVHRRLRRRARAAWRQHQRYGMSNARLYARFRLHGMRPERLRHVMAVYGWLLLTSPALVVPAHRHHWSRVAGLRLGRLRASWRHRVWFP